MTAEADSVELRWREKWLAFRVGLLIPLIEFCMRRTSFRGTQRALLRLAHCLPPYFASPVTLERAVAIGELVELGNTRYSLYRADCLTLSLALQYTINRLGGEANICLGVRTTAGQFEAHAWVEVNGKPLNQLENVNAVYTRMDWTKTSQAQPYA